MVRSLVATGPPSLTIWLWLNSSDSTCCLSGLGSFFQRLQDALGGDGEGEEPGADRVGYGVRDGGRRVGVGELADRLGFVGAGAATGADQDGLQRRHVGHRRKLVFPQMAVDDASLLRDQLLRERHPDAIAHAAVDL